MIVFDKFTLPQSIVAGSSDIQIITDDSWGPSTINKSTRTISSKTYNMDIGNNKLVISNPGIDFDTILLYDYIANGGNTVNLSNLNINMNISDFNAILQVRLTLKDVKGSRSVITRQVENNTITWSAIAIRVNGPNLLLNQIVSIEFKFQMQILNIPLIVNSITSNVGVLNTCGY